MADEASGLRTIVLIRHGQPVPVDEQKRCVSRTELPLSEEGEKQAEQIGDCLAGQRITALFSSPRLRCMKTAGIIGDRLKLPVRPDEALTEVSVGDWEGLPFREIQERWPAEYGERGRHIGTCAPPNGESFQEAGQRLDAALRDILRKTEGNLAVVTHGGIARGWLCGLLGKGPDEVFSVRQPWGGITRIIWNGERFQAEDVGIRPALPDEADILRLYRKAETPQPVIDHCRAVADRARRLACNAPAGTDIALLNTACLLHDLCRTEGKSHPAAAAKILEAEGWPRLAEVIGQHHDLSEHPTVEAELLALADRLTEGTRPISIEERFEASRKKCASPEAAANWRRRYDEALRLERKYMPGHD